MFQWDRNNLRKNRAHRIEREEAEQALRNDPILVYEQEVEGEPRFIYYGETAQGRLLALIVTERDEKIRVVSACHSEEPKVTKNLLSRRWAKACVCQEAGGGRVKR